MFIHKIRNSIPFFLFFSLVIIEQIYPSQNNMFAKLFYMITIILLTIVIVCLTVNKLKHKRNNKPYF